MYILCSEVKEYHGADRGGDHVPIVATMRVTHRALKKKHENMYHVAARFTESRQ